MRKRQLLQAANYEAFKRCEPPLDSLSEASEGSEDLYASYESEADQMARYEEIMNTNLGSSLRSARDSGRYSDQFGTSRPGGTPGKVSDMMKRYENMGATQGLQASVTTPSPSTKAEKTPKKKSRSSLSKLKDRILPIRVSGEKKNKRSSLPKQGSLSPTQEGFKPPTIQIMQNNGNRVRTPMQGSVSPSPGPEEFAHLAQATGFAESPPRGVGRHSSFSPTFEGPGVDDFAHIAHTTGFEESPPGQSYMPHDNFNDDGSARKSPQEIISVTPRDGYLASARSAAAGLFGDSAPVDTDSPKKRNYGDYDENQLDESPPKKIKEEEEENDDWLAPTASKGKGKGRAHGANEGFDAMEGEAPGTLDDYFARERHGTPEQPSPPSRDASIRTADALEWEDKDYSKDAIGGDSGVYEEDTLTPRAGAHNPKSESVRNGQSWDDGFQDHVAGDKLRSKGFLPPAYDDSAQFKSPADNCVNTWGERDHGQDIRAGDYQTGSDFGSEDEPRTTRQADAPQARDSESRFGSNNEDETLQAQERSWESPQSSPSGSYQAGLCDRHQDLRAIDNRRAHFDQNPVTQVSPTPPALSESSGRSMQNHEPRSPGYGRSQRGGHQGPSHDYSSRSRDPRHTSSSSRPPPRDHRPAGHRPSQGTYEQPSTSTHTIPRRPVPGHERPHEPTRDSHRPSHENQSTSTTRETSRPNPRHSPQEIEQIKQWQQHMDIECSREYEREISRFPNVIGSEREAMKRSLRDHLSKKYQRKFQRYLDDLERRRANHQAPTGGSSRHRHQPDPGHDVPQRQNTDTESYRTAAAARERELRRLHELEVQQGKRREREVRARTRDEERRDRERRERLEEERRQGEGQERERQERERRERARSRHQPGQGDGLGRRESGRRRDGHGDERYVSSSTKSVQPSQSGVCLPSPMKSGTTRSEAVTGHGLAKPIVTVDKTKLRRKRETEYRHSALASVFLKDGYKVRVTRNETPAED